MPGSLDALLTKVRANTQRTLALAAMLKNGTSAPAPPALPRVVALSLTHVAYTEGDALGHAAAFVTLLPIFAGIFLGTWLLARRELRCGVLVVGYVANAALCDQLKHLYRQPRPPGATLTDYGMPSNHSQTTCFLLAYGLCFMWSGAVVSHARLWKPLAAAAAILATVAVALSRVYLGEHTPAQVIVGSAVGLAAGVGWYLLYAAVRPALRPLLSLGIARYFYIRDAGEIPDVMAREYAWHCSAVAGKES